MNTSIRRRTAALAIAALALAGLVVAPQQATAHSTKKTTVKVSTAVTKNGIVTVTWKYSGKSPATQSLRVYGDKGALNYMTYRPARTTRSFTLSNLTADMHYRIMIVGSKPSVSGSVELTTPPKTSATPTTPGASPSPSPTIPGATPTPTPTPTAPADNRPAAPSGLTAISAINVTNLSFNAALTWTAPANTPVNGYRIEMRKVGGTYLEIAGTPNTSYTVTPLNPSTSYEFRVASINTVGTGEFSAPVTVTTGALPSANPTPTPSPTTTPTPSPTATAPGIPTGLNATARSVNGVMRLSWFAPTSGATVTGYRVEVADANTPWTLLTETAGNVLAVDASDMYVGDAYTFRVTAVANTVRSTPSGQFDFVVPMVQREVATAVRSLQATVSGATATLGWIAPLQTYAMRVTSHKLQFSTDNVNWQNLTDGTAANTAVLSGLQAGGRYYFRVAAVTAAGVGAWSTPVSVQVG